MKQLTEAEISVIHDEHIAPFVKVCCDEAHAHTYARGCFEFQTPVAKAMFLLYRELRSTLWKLDKIKGVVNGVD